MQRWRSAAAAEHDAENESLARPRAARHVVQSRRGRRAHHMVGRRCQAFAAQERRRQLSVLARSTRSAWARAGDIGRVGGDQMAAAERPDRTPHRPPPRSLRHHRRGQGGSEVSRGSGLGARGSRLGACGSIAVLAGLLAFAVACESRAPSPESRATRPESRAPERAVSMPDISGAAPAVQAQLRDAYSALQQKIAPASSPADERAVAYGDMGRLFFATEYLDAAETCFLNAQTLQPNEMRWPYFLAHVHRRRNEPGKAATLFERVLALEPNNVPALVWLGDMRLVEGRPDAAEAPLAKALTLAPRDAAAMDRAGRAALARRNYETAAKDLGAALEIQPRASSLHYPLSLAYRGLGDTRNADAQLRLRGDVDVAPVDPLMQNVGTLLQNASAAEVRGANAMATRQWAEAVIALRQAIALAPDNAFAHLNLGTALFESGDATSALDEFQTAIRLSPGLSKAHSGAGIVFEAAGRDREAIASFTRAVDAEPASVEARMSLADALRRAGREREALPHYADVIARSPAVSQAAFGYAMAQVR